MSLEALYNNADPKTYVGQVKTKQAADVGAVDGINFMDGGRRARNSDQSDVFQREFIRNAEGTYAVGGAQGTVPSTTDKTYPLSRWTPRALELAFNGNNKGPASLSNGFYATTRFRVWRAGQQQANIHNYIPAVNRNQSSTGGYVNQNASARSKALSTSTSTPGTVSTGGTNSGIGILF